MRDRNRIAPTLTALGALWEHNPDLRLGQLLMMVLAPERDPFYVEDDVLLAKLESHLGG